MRHLVSSSAIVAFFGGAIGLAGTAWAEEQQDEQPTTDDSVHWEERLDELFFTDQLESAIWGIRIETLDGEVLYDRGGERALMPASNLKILTSAAALELLGEDYTHTTVVEALGRIDEDGVLHGDLLITGSGDPTLGSWHPDREVNSRQLLAGWVDAVRDVGISEVRGDIVGDGRFFTEEFTLNLWEEVHRSWWYVAGSSSLAMEENAYRVFIRPGEKVGDPARLEFIPPEVTGYIEVINNTRTVAEGEPSNADSTWRSSRGNTVLFEGDIAKDREVINERGSIYDGERYAAFLFKRALEEARIPVKGEPLNIRSLANHERFDGVEEDRRILVVETVSPRLPQVLRNINKVSHNFYSDQIVRTLGALHGAEGSFTGGTGVVANWLEEIGTPGMDNFRMVDGSGLGRTNLIQPRQFTHVLRHMAARGEAASAFQESLGISGEDGGLGRRMTEDFIAGRVRAKTGFIGHARGLSGYVKTSDDQELVFSMICNHFVGPLSRVDSAVDDALRIIAQESFADLTGADE